MCSSDRLQQEDNEKGVSYARNHRKLPYRSVVRVSCPLLFILFLLFLYLSFCSGSSFIGQNDFNSESGSSGVSSSGGCNLESWNCEGSIISIMLRITLLWVQSTCSGSKGLT